jgi:Tol biopolymer transport system component
MVVRKASSTDKALTRLAVAAMLCALTAVVAPPAHTARFGAPSRATTVRLTTDGRSYAPEGLGWSPGGDYIAYYHSEQAGQQLLVRSEDGEVALPVSGLGLPMAAAWSPDAKRIAYVFAKSFEPDSETGIYVWSLETRSSVQMGKGYRYHQFIWDEPVWSPDSQHFVLRIKRGMDPKAYNYASWVFATDGSPAVQLAPNHYDTGSTYAGSWSPDSQQLVVCSRASETSGKGVWLCRPDGSEMRELVALPLGRSVSDPLWSPDGKWIAYGSDQGRLEDEVVPEYIVEEDDYWYPERMRDIWVVRPDGSDNHSVTHGRSVSTEGRMHFGDYLWSPDSKRLCAVGWRLDSLGIKHAGIYLVEIDTENLVEILANTRESNEAIRGFRKTIAWDHSGKRLVLTARTHERQGEPGQGERLTNTRDLLALYDVTPRALTTLLAVQPDGEARRLSTMWGAWKPSWSADDRRILFAEARVISLAEGRYEPDLYLVKLGPASVGVAEVAKPQPSPAAAGSAETPPAPAPVGVAEVAKPQPSPAAAGPAETPPAPAPVGSAGAGSAVIIVPRHRRASEIAAALPDNYRGLYQPDAGLNALVVTAPDDATLAAFRSDVALLDRPVPQIMVDVLVTELSNDASRQLGLNWEYARGSFSAVLPLVSGAAAGEAIYRGVGSFDKSFFATLALLAEQGQANVRANPRVLTRAGSQASINIRRTDNFFYDAGTDYTGRALRARSDISADIILRITSQLLASGRIGVAIDATVDSFVFGGSDALPDTTRRQATTDVICGDGETIVIGGLTQEEETIKRQKTPLLGDLPLLGQLFRHTARSIRQSTLVIFITPRLVKTDEAEADSGAL